MTKGKDMTTRYEVRGAHWYSEKDDWEQGCIAPSADGFTDAHLSADTVPELLAMLRLQVCAAPTDDVEPDLDACDEDGRVDLCGTTTDLYEPCSWATMAELEAWKRGERECFYTVWTFYVERVTRETVALEGVNA